MLELGLKENVEMYESLISAYSEAHRHYHDLSHLQMVLKQFASVEQLAENKSHVELALWFHDAVYKLFSTTNEKDSAKWASDFLQASGATKDVVESVAGLIRATSHTSAATSNDEKLIVDIDLSVLGQPQKVYEKYSIDVRREYRLVPQFIYNKKRSKILCSFMSKSRIFFFDEFEILLGKQAANNVHNELLSLGVIKC
ncbi:hypothetical protein KUL42_11820 [Alteromonas sp. KUL42]|nr:hypothetical protein KUL42_11820 [Alteromonas sp. KUL42]